MARLATYRAKRDFGTTPEPRGKAARKRGRSFVIQKHAARALHYDLRLEHGGVMKSWAVTRGPSLVPGKKRLAVHVEDHPIEYNSFEGTIPKGQYGGGTVLIWDRGTWTPEQEPDKGLRKGHLDFTLAGRKLKGRWHLVRMRPRPGERQEPWLLIKSDDEYARGAGEPDILEERPNSVASRRSIEQIAKGASRVWHSNRPAAEQSGRKVSAKAKAAMRAGGHARPKRKKKAAARKAKAGASRSGKAPSSKKGGSSPRPDVSGLAGVRRASLPRFVPPSLATLSTSAPSAGRWVHEIKFDGYRIQARIAEDGRVTLRTRTGLDWTDRFRRIADALKGAGIGPAILDGEVVAEEPKGAPDFSALQNDLKTGRQDRIVYYVFDLLHLDSSDLTGAALHDRQRALDGLLGAQNGGAIRRSEPFETDGPLLYKHACRLGLEGIVSKRADRPYRSGRTADWLKTKCIGNQEFVVAGYEPSGNSSRAIRSLILGYRRDGKLRYAGRVGTGWTGRVERELVSRLRPLHTAKAPFDPPPTEERGRNPQWVEPRLVAEVDFRGWTAGALVRQASLKGLRDDKPATEIVRETAMERPKQAALRQKSPRRTARPGKSKRARGEAAGVALTHPGRVYWDDCGVTKKELADYYVRVWPRMKPHVADRVLALLRCPDGASGQCFYQKHASAGIDRAHLREVKEPDGEVSMTIRDLPGLLSLAQAGALEVHVRGSSADRLEQADRLVFDLDPGPGVEWNEVKDAARLVRERLEALGLKAYVKTTGGKGLHVVAPVRPVAWDRAKAFCRDIAETLAGEEPKRFTATVKKAARKGRIFIDYLRNSREATAVAPYSTRARAGATVAAPLSWPELARIQSSGQFDVRTMLKRIARQRRDPWAGMAAAARDLPAAKSARKTSVRK